MFLHSFTVSTVGEYDPAVATIANRDECNVTLSCRGRFPTVVRNVLRLQVMLWEFC